VWGNHEVKDLKFDPAEMKVTNFIIEFEEPAKFWARFMTLLFNWELRVIHHMQEHLPTPSANIREFTNYVRLSRRGQLFRISH